MNDIFILYKMTDATEGLVTQFGNDLSDCLDNTFRSTPINATFKFYDFALGDENIFESNRSNILLCLIDDEIFYDPICRMIWDSFRSRQKGMNEQIVYPVLLYNKELATSSAKYSYVDKSNFVNFDKSKLDLFSFAESMGFYYIDNEHENDKPQLFSAITDVIPALQENGIDENSKENLPKSNVNSVFGDIESNLELYTKQETDGILLKAFNTFTNRKYKEHEPVCVIYTGGTAGMIHEHNSLDLKQADLTELVRNLPRLKREEFDIDFYSFKEPIDSSNIKIDHWLIMSKFIVEFYNKYQGFVIIHGANTLAYTASVLSFLLENVDKPIILTGSELALTQLNNDAEQNIQRSIEIAAYKSNGEQNVNNVCILFGKRLILGNRATKQIALDTAEGFYSPNYPELASVSHDRINIDTSRLPILNRGTLRADEKLSIKNNGLIDFKTKIIIFEVYPDMDMKIFEQTCLSPEVGAVIIKTYGTGGVPSETKEFIDCLDALQKNHKVVVNLTQCPKGNVELRLFETNATLFNYGVISGGDMVTEAAYSKLRHLFAKFANLPNGSEEEKELKAEIIRHYMMVSMRGELSENMFVVSIPIPENIESTANGSVFIIGQETILPRNEYWSNNPAESANEKLKDDKKITGLARDAFAKFGSNLHITSAVLRLGRVFVKRVDKEEKAEIKLAVSIYTKDNFSKKIVEHKKQYTLKKDDNTQIGVNLIDINIDILGLARSVLEPDAEYTVSVKPISNTLWVKDVKILLSAVEKR